MEIRKEFAKYPYTPDKNDRGKIVFIISSNIYCITLDYIEKLFEEALKDFPYLKTKDINIVKYNRGDHKGTAGIMFILITDPIKGYKEKDSIECISI